MVYVKGLIQPISTEDKKDAATDTLISTGELVFLVLVLDSIPNFVLSLLEEELRQLLLVVTVKVKSVVAVTFQVGYFINLKQHDFAPGFCAQKRRAVY